MALIPHPIPHLLCRLAGPVSIAALLAGCSQSLFANPGGGSGGPDGGDIDGGNDTRDGDPGDGGNDRPDAAPSPDCPEPCLGDAVAEFAGDMSAPWFYGTDLPDLFGFSSTEMFFGDVGGADAWYGSSVPIPAILHCPSFPNYPSCVGMGEKLLFETTESDSPTLAWLRGLEDRPTYRFSGEWRMPSGLPVDKTVTLRVARNTEFDVLYQETLTAEETEPGTFDFELDALPEDNLRLIAISGDSTRVPVALSFYASGTEAESACLLSPEFPASNDIQNPIPDACGTSSFVHADDTESCSDPNPLCPRTESTTGPLGLFRFARKFVVGSSLVYEGNPNDYGGDWTVQFWAYFDRDATGIEMMISDANCFAERGINVYREISTPGTSEMLFEAFYPDDQADRCLLGPASISTSVSNEAWHFFRIARSVEDQLMYLCVDGLYAGNVPLPEGDMTATEPMRLGRDSLTPAVFNGTLADVRVFKRALPCPGQ